MSHEPLPPHLSDLERQLVAAARGRTAPTARPRRTPWLAGATLAATVVAIAVVLLIGASASPPPAYAVSVHRDGTVWVKLLGRTGVPGANRRLASMGIQERVRAAAADSRFPQTCRLWERASGAQPAGGPPAGPGWVHVAGTSGPSGVGDTSGTGGTSGTSGTSGASGTSGPAGATPPPPPTGRRVVQATVIDCVAASQTASTNTNTTTSGSGPAGDAGVTGNS